MKFAWKPRKCGQGYIYSFLKIHSFPLFQFERKFCSINSFILNSYYSTSFINNKQNHFDSLPLQLGRKQVGEFGNANLKFFFLGNQNIISPWHNISLKNPNGTYNMIVEIPKNTLEKFEISTQTEFNPIMYDLNKYNNIRYYFKAIKWNYGALPQTWENPNLTLDSILKEIKLFGKKSEKGKAENKVEQVIETEKNELTRTNDQNLEKNDREQEKKIDKNQFEYVNFLFLNKSTIRKNEYQQVKGDNDPLDLIDISTITSKVADVVPVKILGALCMIDSGELDWKIIVIQESDPKYHLVNDIYDIELHFPGTIDEIREWFRIYKVYEGKQENKFGFEGKPFDKNLAISVVEENHKSYMQLVKGHVDAGKLWIC